MSRFATIDAGANSALIQFAKAQGDDRGTRRGLMADRFANK